MIGSLRKSPQRRVATRLMSPDPCRRAFTLQELLVVFASLGALVLIVMFLFPRRHHGDSSTRIKCGSNLRQIGQALQQYARDYDGQFPRTRYDPDDPTPRFFTNPTASNPFAPDGPEPNDVTAAWFLLLRHSDLISETFLCPETLNGESLRYTDFTGRNDKRSMSNFPGREFISYSFANPYPAREAGEWNWTNGLPSTFAVAADINPGVPELLARDAVTFDNKAMRTLNSPNHRGEGQNVLFADGSVRYAHTPFEGMLRDNIYTAGGPPAQPPNPPKADVAIVSPPLTPSDSVLLPIATGEPVRARVPREEAARRFWRWIGLPSVVFGGLLIVLVIVRSNRARRRKLDRGELPEMPPPPPPR